MWGSDKTYKQLSGGNANSANQAVIRNAVNIANSSSNSAVQKQMEAAAQANNWDLVGSLANQLATPDGYYGNYDMSYANSVFGELADKYNYDFNEYYRGLVDAVYGDGAWDGAININLGSSSNLDKILDQLAGMSFEKWMKGDQYADLEKYYGNLGQMSMKDVMGQVASNTGGLASSYATTAAQMQQNNWMSELARVAMEMYNGEVDDLMDKAQLLRQVENDSYNKQMAQTQLEKDDLMAIAETLAAYGDFSGYKALGYTDNQIAAMTSGYNAQLAAKSATKSATKSTTDDSAAPELDYDGLFAAARESGHPKSFIANNYKKYGFTSSTGLYDEYEDWDIEYSEPTGMPTHDPISSYGTNYSTIWAQARKMYDNGSSTEAIQAYLDKFDETQLTDAGLEYIMNSLNLGGYREG